MEMYQRLVCYKSDHNGSTEVPRKEDQDRAFGDWVHRQRFVEGKKGRTKAHMKLLDAIGFDRRYTPSRREEREWMEMYQRLVSYKEEHDGSVDVPHKYDKDRKLGEWVSHQRQIRNRKGYTKLLDAIGLKTEDEIRDIKWMEMYQRLVSYKNDHNGSTLVPQKSELGKWVDRHRGKIKREDHRKLINDIGLETLNQVKERRWMEMYQRLVCYKNNHYGSIKFPRKYKKDPELKQWCNIQRKEQSRGNQTEERKKLLDDIGIGR